MPLIRRDQPVPLYHQIEVALRRAIDSGELPVGRLPTEQELVDRYRVSRMTVRSALRRLEEDGLIERHRGRGTFVRPDATGKIVRHPEHVLGFEDDLRRQGAEPEITVLALEMLEPPLGIARALGLPAGEAAHRVRRLGRVNGEPLWLESRYYPPAVGVRMAACDLSGASVTGLLERVLGVRVAGVELRVEAGSATARQARHLNVRTGHALLVNQFRFYDADGRALEVLRAAFRGDRYAFSFDLSPRPPFDGELPWGHANGNATLAWPALVGHLQSETAVAGNLHEEGTR